jgi:triosephosphate isomerase
MTTPGVKPLIAGNWKMNGLRAALGELAAIAAASPGLAAKADLLICLPATLIGDGAVAVSGAPVAIGGQDCHAKSSGAHTGDIAAAMLADVGASAVIVGHSERRTDHGETDATVKAKAAAAIAANLLAVVCIGETGEERKTGRTLAVLKRQLSGSLPDAGEFAVAYEPVWAIGTGLTPTPADIAEAHAFLRAELVARFGETGRTIRLLYGGSVKPDNAAAILRIANVDGALVGGASLKAADFLAIAKGVD